MAQESSEDLSTFTDGQQRFLDRWGKLPFITMAGTAKAVGVSALTAYQWRKDSAFRAAMAEARKGVFDALSDEALAILHKNLPAVMRRKVHLATAANVDARAQDSAGTWLLEHAIGKGEAGTQTLNHSGEVSLNVGAFFAEIEKRWGESSEEHQPISPDASSA